MATPSRCTALPGPLRLTPSFPFAGRARELAALPALVPATDGEGLRLALVGGEAGSGKSRLVREFAHEAASDGALVLYGACDSVVRSPYGPFVEALCSLSVGIDAETLREAIWARGRRAVTAAAGPAGSGRRADARRPASTPTPSATASTARSATCSWRSAREAPLVLVIEDAHWADTPTLLLLRHLARGASDARALLVATFRDTEAEVHEPLAAALVDLRRSDGVVAAAPRRRSALTRSPSSYERAGGSELSSRPARPRHGRFTI